jgi:hypothetical protein
VSEPALTESKGRVTRIEIVHQELSPWPQEITENHEEQNRNKKKQKITLVQSNQKELCCVRDLSLELTTNLPSSERGKNAQRCQQKLGRYKRLPIVQPIEI